MSPKPTILMDIGFRSTDEIFTPEDLERLHAMSTVITDGDAAKEKIEAVICTEWHFGPLDDYPRLRAVIDVAGVHFPSDRFDYETAFRCRIRVLSCAPAFGPQVAEMALAMALASSREVCLGDAAFKRGEELYLHAGNDRTFTLFGKTVGFVGLGGIARNLQKLLAPFACDLMAYDPWLPDSFVENQGVRPVTLEELMRSCDVVFVIAVVSKENAGMITRAHLESMRPGAVFVLAGRAHVVDFDALTDVLGRGEIRAAIDVFPAEPLPPDHPIRSAPNTVLSAHRAGSVRDDLRLIGRMVVDDLEAMFRGIPPRRLQNAEPELVWRR